MLALLAALQTLAYRGNGPDAWAAPLTSDPIAFLLDATSDAVLVWSAPDRLLYANRAAEQLDLRAPGSPGITRIRDRGYELERRALRFPIHAVTYTVEVVRTLLAPKRRGP